MRWSRSLLLALPLALASAGCGLREAYVSPQLASPTVEPLASGDRALSVYLIGDAGEPSTIGREPTFVALEHEVLRDPSHSLIVFLGDNIYPRGLPRSDDPSRAAAEWALMEQLRILRTSRARGIFISGNHDWDWGGSEGLEAIARQERFIRDSSDGLAALLPAAGCPGPEVVDLGFSVRLVLLNTEWWLSPHPAGSGVGAGCQPKATESGILTSLGRALTDSTVHLVMVAGHHPLESYGTHGGFFPWEDHIFPLRHLASWLWVPLPVIGSAYPVARMMGISDQDLAGSRYRHMIDALDSVFAETPPLLYASGHEHTLQVLRGSRPYPLLVSGNGIEAHDDPLTSASSMLFGDTDPGFMRVDVAHDGAVRLAVLQPADRRGAVRESFSIWLRRSPAARPQELSSGRKNW